MTIFLLILGLLLFIALVLVHEWGHFIMARRNGVEVEEFGLGFPPRAKVLTKRRGTEYTLNWLPLGGFVKLKGEHDADTEKGTFGAASTWAKTKIMLAGVVMNLVSAFVLLTLLALLGIPHLINQANQGEDQYTLARNQQIVTKQVLVSFVDQDSPAKQAGLKQLDEIQTLTGADGASRQVSQVTDLQAASKAFAGQKVSVTFKREGKQQVATVQLRDEKTVSAAAKANHPIGYMGIGLSDYQVDRYTWGAPVVAVGTMTQLTRLTLKGLGAAVSGLGKLLAGLFTGNTSARQAGQVQATEQVSGPLGIFFVLQAGAKQGMGMVLFIIAIISLTLAIMNALPIPALDGGRLFVTLVYRAVRRPLTQHAEELIHGTGFAVLMVLFLLITIVDAGRFF